MRVQTLLVTGASGNVGTDTLRALTAVGGEDSAARGGRGVAPSASGEIRAGLRRPGHGNPRNPGAIPPGVQEVRLDFTKPETFGPALAGIDRLLLVRPPALADVDRYFRPFLEAAGAAGVRHVVFLSVMGAESVSFIPHAKIERLLQESGMDWTFLRPAFFNQNLSTTHLEQIRDEDRISVPAGGGRTSFVDTRDIGVVAARALTERGHEGQAYTLTSDDILSYREVAEILSEELGRGIRYTRPGTLRFILQERRKGTALQFAILMAGIYLPTRLGRAERRDDTLRRLLGREPISFRSFVQDHRDLWAAGE